MQPWDSWVDAPVTHIGVAEAFSKCGPSIDWNDCVDRYICYGHNLFGSPCFETWTNTPGNMLVTHPSRIPVRVPTVFTVTVTDTLTSDPLQHAKVCLHKANDIYEVGLTDADGQVAFTIRPQTTGEIKVTVTRAHDADLNYNQYRPSQTVCRVSEDTEEGGQASGSGEVAPLKLCITEMPTILSNSCAIRFGVPYVPHKEEITISVYNVIGSRVRTIRRKDMPAGYYHEWLDIGPFANGVYFIVLRQGSEVVNRKFLVIR
jgi:hypothetical protein